MFRLPHLERRDIQPVPVPIFSCACHLPNPARTESPRMRSPGPPGSRQATQNGITPSHGNRCQSAFIFGGCWHRCWLHVDTLVACFSCLFAIASFNFFLFLNRSNVGPDAMGGDLHFRYFWRHCFVHRCLMSLSSFGKHLARIWLHCWQQAGTILYKLLFNGSVCHFPSFQFPNPLFLNSPSFNSSLRRSLTFAILHCLSTLFYHFSFPVFRFPKEIHATKKDTY